jgi:thymidylate kinase
MLGHGHVVLCESYYFKFLAKERVLQLAELELIEGLGLLPSPDLIVDVSIRPEVAFERIATSLNEYETFTGMANWDGFRRFQERVRYELDAIVSAAGVPVLTVDGSNEVGLDFSYIHDWISDHLETGPAEL